MPRLMEKKDWIQTVANVGAAESVWCENISSDGDAVPLPLPGCGTYQVILVKINALRPPVKSGAPIRKNRRRIGAMAGRWPDYSYERDREIDAEIAADCDVFKGCAL